MDLSTGAMINPLLPTPTRQALEGHAKGDASCLEHLKQRWKQLEDLRKKRGLECCVISRLEHEAISKVINDAAG